MTSFQEVEEEKEMAVGEDSTESREDGTTIATAKAGQARTDRMVKGVVEVTEAMVGVEGEVEEEEAGDSGVTTPSMTDTSPTILPQTSLAVVVLQASRIQGKTVESKTGVTTAMEVKVVMGAVEEEVAVMVVHQVVMVAIVAVEEEEVEAMVVHQVPQVVTEVMVEDRTITMATNNMVRASFTNTTIGHRTVEGVVVVEEVEVGEVAAVVGVVTEAP